MTTSIIHPTTGEEVFIILDPCHMLKLARNALAHLGTIVDGEGNAIRWHHIEELQKLQEVEGLNLGNKLSPNHLKFQKHKMNVRLAAQTLSSSVANAVEFLDKSMKLPSFRNRHGTVIFIRTIFISTEFSLPNCNRVPDTPSPVKQGHIGRNVDVNSRLSAVIENKYSYRSTTLHLAS